MPPSKLKSHPPSIVCFISPKGGSGKTVTSTALATFLSSIGFDVLLIDTDAATNGLTLFFLERLLAKRRIASVDALPRFGIFDATTQTPPNVFEVSPHLHLLPSSYSMSETETKDVNEFHATLKTFIENSNEYDIIILDAQAGTDNFARVATTLADQSVIVSEYDPISVQGIERLKVQFGSVLNPGNTWVLF